MKLPWFRVVWVDPAKWWRDLVWERNLSAWEKHCDVCARCMSWAKNDEPVTPCQPGRVLLDRRYPDAVSTANRRAWYAKKDARIE